MKQVTIDNVRERIAELEMVNSHGELSLRGEFELACLRMLAASMGVKPFMYGIADPDGAPHMDECCVSTSMAGIEDYVHMLNEECEEGGPLFTVVPLYTAPPSQVTGVDDDVRNVVGLLENNEWAEHCTKTDIGHRLESEITRLVGNMGPVPVARDADPSFDAMMRALDAFYADDNVPERAMLSAFRILLADVREKPALVVTDDIMEEINRWDTDRCFVGRKHYTQQQNSLIDAYIGLTEPKAPVVTDDRLLENLETRIRSLEIGERKGALSTQQETSLKAYRLAVQCLRSSASSDENATDNTAQQFEALAGSHAKPTAAPIIPEGLHPDTADLVIRFATALAEKLHRAEQKYGHANGWMATGWYNECLQQLWDHVEKGDPLDVAAYCAFMWHHGWVTTDYDRGVQQALATSAGSGKP